MRKKSRSKNSATFEFTRFNKGFFHFIKKIHNFAMKKVSLASRDLRDSFWGNNCRKYCMTRLNINKGAKSIEIASSGPIVFAYLF